MKKTTFSHSLLSLCLLFLISILGGGNAVNAQSYQLVTSTDGLVSGDKYLIVSKDRKDALSTTQNPNNRGVQTVSFAADGSIDAVTLNANVAIIQLKSELNGLWSLQVTNGLDETQGYLYAAGTKTSKTNYLQTTKTPTDCDYRAEITIEESTGKATIEFENNAGTAGLPRSLRRNSAKGTNLYSCYSSGQYPVYLYHYVAPTGTTDPELSYTPSTLTIAANGTLTQPELNNPNGVTIKSYSSSKPSVATVTDEGVIALAGGTGTATITATSQANDTYKAGTATYTLTVFGAPEITPKSGEYENNVTVVMNATGASALFYTTDGTDPRADINAATMVTDFPYNLPLSVGEHTIKAVTADESLEVYSDVLTRTYTVVLAVPTPQLSQAAGNYNYEVAVNVTVANSGGAVGFVYTTDGTDPATSNTATTVNALTGTVTLYKGEHTLTVKSFTAGKANFSDAATAVYTVALPQPVITPSAESTQEKPITVTIEAEGAPYIWYTTDGTDPLASGVTPVQVEGSSTIVTLTEVGTYTITAVGVNNNVETSAAATATCTINKVIPVPGSATMKYKKVTSMDDIVDGGVYLLVCPEFSEAMSTRENSMKYAGVGSVSFEDEAKTIISSISTINESSYPCELVLEAVPGEDGVYYIKDAGSYIYCSSSKTLGSNESLPADKTKYKWTISFNTEDWGQGRIAILNTSAGNRTLDINESTTPHRFSTYVINNTITWSSPSFLYKKTFDLSVNANTAGYATAYTTFPYVMPTGANGYIVTETAEGETIKAKQKYPAGAEVPANAPLLIKNADAGVTLNPVVLGKTVEAYPYAEENLLHGTRLESDGVTTDVDGTGTKTGDYYYYKLSYKRDAEKKPVPDSYGFYRGKADGSAFAMQNTLTAYLALPKSSGGQVNNLRISIDNEEGPTTGIQANRLPADNMPQSVYTLSGVRVNAAGNRLPKGIYIVNGKKVVIK